MNGLELLTSGGPVAVVLLIVKILKSSTNLAGVWLMVAAGVIAAVATVGVQLQAGASPWPWADMLVQWAQTWATAMGVHAGLSAVKRSAQKPS